MSLHHNFSLLKNGLNYRTGTTPPPPLLLLDPSPYLLDPSLYLLDPSPFLPSAFLCLLFLCSAPDVYLSTSLTYSLNALLFNKIFGDDGDWVLHLGEILGMFGVGAGNKSLLPRGVWGRAISLLRVKGIGIRWGWWGGGGSSGARCGWGTEAWRELFKGARLG